MVNARLSDTYFKKLQKLARERHASIPETAGELLSRAIDQLMTESTQNPIEELRAMIIGLEKRIEIIEKELGIEREEYVPNPEISRTPKKHTRFQSKTRSFKRRSQLNHQ